MSRPIAYNASGPLSGSIRGGNVNYTVDSGNRDYTTFASKKWVPSADGAAPIVFVTDSYTQGLTNQANAYPLFYACAGTGSAAILYTANRIPNSPGNYNDANVALNDLITARGYFILESNDPYQGIDADSLAFDVDASKMSSYPQTGTSWYDLSGNGNSGALTNGPTWNSNGWFQFDGVDDYVDTNNTFQFAQSGQFSVCGLINVQDHSFRPAAAAGIIGKGHFYANSWDIWLYNDERVFFETTGNTVNVDTYYLASDPLTVGRWYFFAATYNNTAKNLWINGTQYSNTYLGPGGFTNGNNVLIARRSGDASRSLIGSGSAFSIYSRSLSTAEVEQNYFGAPIVTDGLVFAVDANNIVSYPKSGTSWYGLTGSINGTLTNGPTFNPSNGGSIVFDGADDYVATNLTQTFTNELTVETWYRGTKSTRNHLWNFAGSNLNCNFNDTGFTLWMYWEGDGGNALRFTSPNFTDNNIHHLVFRHSGSINQIYFDGQLLTPAETFGTQTFTGVGGGGYNIGASPAFGGNVYTNRVYNRALSAAEVLQNYQAEQYRFETPAGPVTNGLVLYWDAGNLDSYPGTGTTIYDLSGNGNNGTLVNGVTYNQTNGGVLITDGIDDYIYCSTPNLSSTNFTEMGAARYISFVRPGGTYPGGRMINANSNNWLMGHWGNTVDNYYAEGTITGINGSISDLNWRIYAGNGDISGDVYSFYMNNSLYASNGGGAQGPNGVMIGKYPSSNLENANGAFSFLLIYNRILTSAEMTQNYNYFKGRFGL